MEPDTPAPPLRPPYPGPGYVWAMLPRGRRGWVELVELVEEEGVEEEGEEE